MLIPPRAIGAPTRHRPADRQCPLFPLDTVLVPGGVLPLRIFEPRYLDMVRECARDDRPFGVCLLLPGTGEQDHSHHARVGTLAGIVRYITAPDGSHHVIA